MIEIGCGGELAVIINADDLGYSQGRDQAAFRLIERGAVTSASLMVNMPNSKNAVRRCLQLGFRVGLHLNLTEGKPLSGKLSSLTNQNGEFMGKPAFYPPNNQLPLLNAEHLYTEICLQFEWFVREFDRLPTHVDGHNHVHMVPVVAKVLVGVLQQFGCYKYRLPIEPITEKCSDFRRILASNIEQSRPIYEERNMVSTNFFIGLELIHSFRLDSLKAAFQWIEKRTQEESNPDTLFVELMVHPGIIPPAYQPTADVFHNCQNRRNEFELLQSNQMKKMLQRYRLVGWQSLSCPKPYLERRLLIHSLMKRGTGNYTSCLRLRDILTDLGYRVYIRNIQEHSELVKRNEINDIEEFCRHFSVDLAIGINIYRSGILLKDAFYHKERICYQTPYYLMIAGTDANIYIKQSELKPHLLQAIQLSQGLISLNQPLAQTVRENMGELSTKISLIPQSDSEYELDVGEFEEVKKELGIGNRPYILFPASIRKVKDIGFGLVEFNRIIEKYGLDVLILGPIIEPSYAEMVLPQLGKVRYVGTVSHNKLLALLKNSVCLVNTSTSEGMSNAILEAQINGVLAVARANDGNKSLVQHRQSGLLFETAEELEENLTWALDHNAEVRQLVKQTRIESLKRFSKEKEIASYRQLLQAHFSKQSYLECNGKKFTVTGSEWSHPVSYVNCQLFQQIPNIEGKKVIDLGCGTGILSFYYLCRAAVHETLLLLDISLRTLGNCFFNMVQNKHLLRSIKTIVLLQSDMFTEVNNKNIKYDVILANMPQTPFPVEGVRLDKNGGQDGLKYNRIALEQLSKQHRPISLVTLYSHMSHPKQYFGLLQRLHLELNWKSEPLKHRISSVAYNKMAPHLTEYLMDLRAKGFCSFETDGDDFLVAAQLFLIHNH